MNILKQRTKISKKSFSLSWFRDIKIVDENNVKIPDGTSKFGPVNKRTGLSKNSEKLRDKTYSPIFTSSKTAVLDSPYFC